MGLLSFIDRRLNGITMYRLLAYGLGVVLALAALMAAAGRLPFELVPLVVSTGVLVAVAYAANIGLARIYVVPANSESALITALILACILNPVLTFSGLAGLAVAALLAMVSKYVLTIRQSHMFNPAAIAAVIVGYFELARVTWWIGSASLLPLTLIFGFLIVRKIRRLEMVLTFIVAAAALIVATGVIVDATPFTEVPLEAFQSWPIVFLGSVMLTEPLTAPPTRSTRLVYALLVAYLLGTRWHVGTLYTSPALALVVANLYSGLIVVRQRIRLTLKEIIKMSPTTWDFVFSSPVQIKYAAGQYAEWTLPLRKGDDRGNRRTFTIASAPTEKEVHLGVKFYQPSSRYKDRLKELAVGEQILLGPVAGDFTLPKQDGPVVLVAGGVGITPFRSMLVDRMASHKKLDGLLIYVASNAEEIVYKDVLEKAEKAGLKVIYVLSDGQKAPKGWEVRQGPLNKSLLKELVAERFVKSRAYVSGPPGFVDTVRASLWAAGISRRRIKADYFSGY